MAISHLFRCILQNHKAALFHRRRHFYSIGDNIVRILDNELTYLIDYKPPLQPPKHYRSYTITDTAGSQWVRFKRYDPYRNEHVKIDATMFDGLAPIPEHLQRVYEGEERLHSSVTVEVRKGEEEDEDDEGVLVIVCLAWPESIEVKKVFPVKKGNGKAAKQPNMSRNFKDLSEEMQKSILDYLEQREINNELAEFIHVYMANKDRLELYRWLNTIKAYIDK